MRWLFGLAMVVVVLGGSVALGQRGYIPPVHVEPFRPPPPVIEPYRPPPVAQPYHPPPIAEPYRAPPQVEPYRPPAVASAIPQNGRALTCAEVCTSRARQCGALEQALQDATWQKTQEWLDYWDDTPDNSPDPPCVRGYNQCRWQC